MNDLAKVVYLYNDSEPFSAKWDGKEYTLSKDPTEIQLGVAQHWQNRFKGAALRIEEIPTAEIERRRPTNPLEDNDRGEAFAGVRKRRKASDE